MKALSRMKKPRCPMAGSFGPQAERWIRQQQQRFGASRSHVIVTAVAYVAVVDEDQDLHIPKRRSRKLRLVG